MADEKDSSCHNICVNDPNFAIICSFFDRFASTCGISHPTFSELQEMIESSQEIPPELIDLHIKLLRKIRRSVATEKWERALIKFCHSYYCNEEGWELERGGYKKCKVPIRLKILKTLLDAQFDLNSKFKTDINKLTAEELRLDPLGRDKVGQSYWCQFDPASNVRVYKEDQDEETWKLVAKDREGLVDLITQLSSGEELLGLELINEDSNSQEVEKPITDTGQVQMSTSEENTADNVSSVDNNIENSVKKEEHDNSDNRLCIVDNTSVDNIENESKKTEQFVSGKESNGLSENAVLQTNSENGNHITDSDTTVNNVSASSQYEDDRTISIPTNMTETKLLDDKKSDFSNISENDVSKSYSRDEDNLLVSEVSETESINVAEEIKQRSLIKSSSLPLSKGRVSNKPLMGSKLDQIFSHKLESKNIVSKTNDLVSVVKTSSHIVDEQERYSEKNQLIKMKDMDKNIYIKNEECSINENNKRINELEELNENPQKKQLLEKEFDEEVGEEIEEPVMFFKGEGSGKDCDTGNPGREKEESVGTTNTLNSMTSSKNIIKKLDDQDQINSNSDNSNFENSDDIRMLSKNINNCLVENKDSLFCDDGKTTENHKIHEDVCKSSQSLNGSDEVRDIKTDSTNCEKDIVDQKNDDLDEHEKSIEEQMSLLTGESLSPKEQHSDPLPKNIEEESDSHSENNSTEIKILENSSNFRNTSKDIETISQEAKADKDRSDILDCLNSNSAHSTDIVNNITDTKINPPNTECNPNIKMNAEELSCTNNKHTAEIENDSENNCKNKPVLVENGRSELIINELPSKEKNNHELIDKNVQVLNKKSSLSNLKGVRKGDKKGSKSKRNIEKTPHIDDKILSSEEQIALNDSTVDNSEKDDSKPVTSSLAKDDSASLNVAAVIENCSIDNKLDAGTENCEENSLCDKSNKVSEESENETKLLKSENETEDLENNSEIIRSDEHIKTPNKKALVKKSPKPRRKKFTPRSRKRVTKITENNLKKDAITENVLENKASIQSKKRGGRGDVSEKFVEEKQTSPDSISKETSKDTKENRKRRSSRRNTATEKDSEEDSVIYKNEEEKTVDEEDEIGGKRRKVKGRRAPNKSLRKSIENKRKSNSSSEEDQSKDDEGKDTKKSPPSLKQKINKGHIIAKSGEKKNVTPVGKPKKEDNEGSRKPKSQGRNSRAYLGIDLNIDINESSRSVRQSSRLAQIKIKEQADHKIVDESHQKADKSTKKSTKKKNENEEKQKGTPKKQKRNKVKSSDEEVPEEEVEKKKRRRKKKKNPVRAFNERDPWKSSSGSSSEAEEEEEEYHFDDIGEEEEDLPLTIKSDHEFSPESDIEGDDDVKPIRHARTAQKDPSTEEGDTDDFACEKCSKKDHPEWILLCDTCDNGWHASCLRPSLMLVPEGDWHCPPCQHTMLVKKLQETLKIFDRDSKRRENEELRKKRLAYVGISLDNVLPSNANVQHPQKERVDESETSESSEYGSESESQESDEPVYQLRQRRQGTNTYRFSEFDELINSAIQDEVEVKNAVFGILPEIVNSIASKKEEEVSESQIKNEEKKESNETAESKQVVPSDDKKDESTSKPITKSKDKSDEDDSSEEDEDNEEDEEEEFPCVVPKRVNTLPRPGRKKHRRLNCLDDASDDDDGSDEDFKGVSSEEEEEDEEAYDSDDSSTGRRRSKRGHLGPVRRSSRTRRSRFDKEFINDDSEESDAPRRKKTRKLWSDSDSESDDSTWGRRKKKRNQGSSGRRKFKKNKKFTIEDELSETETSKLPKKKRQRKVKYGGLDDLAVEDLPSRRTRGKKINYQEVIGTDSEEEILKPKNLRKAVIDDEDDFVADKEEKEDSESASDEDGEDEENSSDDEGRSKDEKEDDEKEVTVEKKKNDIPKAKASPLLKHSTEEKSEIVKKVKPLQAMIAPPPERLITEDEQYKAIVSKVSTMSHAENPSTDTKLLGPVNFNDQSNSSSESKEYSEYPQNLAPIKIHNMAMDSKLIKRSPPIKIRSGVPVNAGGRRSPLGSPSNEVSFFPIKPVNPELIHSPPEKSQLQQTQSPKNLGLIQASAQQFVTTRKAVDPIIKSEKLNKEDIDTLDEEDYMDDIEEEEDDDEDDSDDDILEEGEIPKKVARKMARMEERILRQQEEKRNPTKVVKHVQSLPTLSPGSTQPPTTTPSEQKPTQPLLRVVSPLKLMANPPGALQSSFIHSGMPPRMPLSSPTVTSRMTMPLRPPQPAGMVAGMTMDDGSPKRRGRGRGKKQLGQEKQDPEMMGGGSVIRGMLQQPQSYPPTHYPQQYPPHPRIPFNPQRMPRPPFHPGHHPLDPSPSGGNTINIKQEPSSNPVHIPNKPPSTSAPPYHTTAPPLRFDSGHQRPVYPAQPLKPQYNSYPNPSGPSANYHYGNYPPPAAVTQREEPQGLPVQQSYTEQFSEQPPAPPTNKMFSEEDSGEFGGLVSYFSSQREDDLDT